MISKAVTDLGQRNMHWRAKKLVQACVEEYRDIEPIRVRRCELLDVYRYGDYLMDLWTLHVNRGLFKLVEASVMVWGVCIWRAMGYLIRLDPTLIRDMYVSILSNPLHLFMSIAHSDGLGEFLQAIRHLTRLELLQSASRIPLLNRWPPNFPGISSIERIWDALQRAVHKKSPPPITSSTASGINQMHTMSCCNTSACS
ncbi:DDE_3 domain-containing protein [Trichonephila clavipes]|nr:DDE_3 domain-containing protein [Trichonephila clavipes]